MNIVEKIISFEEAAQIANASTQSVLLLRHSYRESLANGNHDPSLTQAGWDYAVECGKLLKEIKNLSTDCLERNGHNYELTRYYQAPQMLRFQV